MVKVVGFVACDPDFTGQPGVVNGASELLGAAFGDAGVHARSAVGVAVLPLDAPVEVEIIVEVALTRWPWGASTSITRSRAAPGSRCGPVARVVTRPGGRPAGRRDRDAPARRGRRRPEVYLLRRVATMAFAPT